MRIASEERTTPGGFKYYVGRKLTAWERWRLGKLQFYATAEVWTILAVVACLALWGWIR